MADKTAFTADELHVQWGPAGWIDVSEAGKCGALVIRDSVHRDETSLVFCGGVPRR